MRPPRGFSVTLSPYRRPTLETMPVDAKAGCLYPNNARALFEAHARGFDNAVVCDMLGNVAEFATSNLFTVKDGVVFTPTPNGTFLAGITRKTIYEAPTLAALAALLEKPSLPPFPPLVLLKAGCAAKPPVFITHGVGGTVMDFFQVLRHIETDHPIYGMQARGVDGVAAPFERLEDIAQYHLNALKRQAPRGPFILIGYSLGGLVALEMAQRLRQKGKKVALLAMLDTYPHNRYLSLKQRMRLHLGLLARHASAIKRLPVGEAVSYVFHRSQRRLYIPGDATRSLRYQSPIALSPAIQRARTSAYVALKRYCPGFYPEPVKFVKAEIDTDFPHDPAAVWRESLPKLEVETVPGDHLGIMTTHADSLGRVLSRYLRESAL